MMRRSLDPEGYEDPGIKSSQISLREMSSEWLLWVLGTRGHQHCMGDGIAWGMAMHGGLQCMGTNTAWAPALHG